MKSFKTHVNEAKKGGFVDKAFKTAMAFGAASGVLAGSKALSTRAAPVPQQAPLIERLRNAPTQDELDQLSTEIEFLDGQKQQDAAWEAYRIRNTELNA